MSRIKKNKLQLIAAAVLIILIAFFLRIYSPQSDLPPDISISGSVYTDEGNQCHNSRSRILYGDWFPDNWKITNYNPVVPYFKLLIFKTFGVGLVQVRSVSFFFAFLSLIVFFLILRSYFDSWLSIAGIALLGFNFLFIMYNRIGTFETPMIFWMILVIYFLERYRITGKMIFPFLSGVSAFAAFVFKMTGAHIVPVPATALLLFLIFIPEKELQGRKKIAVSTGIIVASIVISFAVWMAVFYLPNREWIKSAPGSYIGNQMFPKSFEQLIGNILSYNWKEQFFKMWVVWVGAILYLPVFFRRLLQKRADITEIGSVLFLLSHTGALMIMNHRPTRYLIAAIPPMVFLTVLLFRYLLEKNKDFSVTGPIKKVSIFLFDISWLIVSLYYCFLPLLERAGIHIVQVKFTTGLLMISIITIGVIRLLHYIKGRFFGSVSVPRKLLTIMILALISMSVYTNMKYYHFWKRDRTEYVHKISKELGSKIKDGYIAGLTAPVAVLGTEHKSLFLYPEFVHWGKETLDKYGITHALLANFNFEISNFFGQWPNRMRNASLLNIYNVKDQFLHLYSLVDPVISGVERVDDKTLELTIENNGGKSNILLGVIEFNGNIPVRNLLLPETLSVKKGRNLIRISDQFNENEKLIYIKKNKWPGKFRYEAEKFPRKRGRVVRDIASSGNHLRYYNAGTDRKGFMACSIGGKFIPYSEGFMIARFFLKFDRIRSRIRPLAVIDIFNNTLKSSVSFRSIKKKEIKGGDFFGYPVFYKIDKVSDIEFRVLAEKTADIYYDFLELEYFQGKFIDRN
ncbi:MAG: glycosyltransferase family 39 protein [Acidobacteriota bacterium]